MAHSILLKYELRKTGKKKEKSFPSEKAAQHFVERNYYKIKNVQAYQAIMLTPSSL